MRCSVCGRPAVRPIQLCPGCLAAIERAEIDRVRKLDLLVSGDLGTRSAGSCLSPSLDSTEVMLPVTFTRQSHRGPMLAASLSMIAFMALPVTLDVHQRAPHAPLANVITPVVAGVDRRENMDSLAAVQSAAPAVIEEELPASTSRPEPSVVRKPQAVESRSRRTSSKAGRQMATPPSSLVKHAPAAQNTRQAAGQALPAIGPRVPALQTPPQPAVVQAATAGAAPAQARIDEAPPDRATPGPKQALAHCAEQSIFARTWCEHQVRARYCDGRWGQSPECVTGITNDHGG